MVFGQKLLQSIVFTAFMAAAAASAWAQGAGAESTNLVTKDGVQIRVSYYPGGAQKGSKQAKQTTPVVLLHDFKGTRAVFNGLIARLLASGEPGTDHPHFAVVAVDLRAHGESMKQIGPDGTPTDLDAAKFGKDDFVAMAKFDMEAVRRLLLEKNDDGELNINKLCIVGSGMGASVAANWALRDWIAPPLAVGKQGQDVKALVLISPRWSYNGLSLQDPMKFGPLKQSVAWMLICGAQDAKFKSDFERVEKQLERFHPMNDKKPGAAAATRKGFESSMFPSTLQGDKLYSQSAATIDDQVLKFLTENVATVELPWTNRLNKLP